MSQSCSKESRVFVALKLNRSMKLLALIRIFPKLLKRLQAIDPALVQQYRTQRAAHTLVGWIQVI